MSNQQSAVYVVDGSRTPFIKMGIEPGQWSAADLGVAAAQSLLLKHAIDPTDLDEVIAGCVIPAPDEANIARIIALRLGCGPAVRGWTVQRNCASGLQALDCAAQSILSGRHHLVLAGGTEAMSRAPVLYSNALVRWLARWRFEKNKVKRLKYLTELKCSWLEPVFSLVKGLSDPIINLSMGQTAENLSYEFEISRKHMDLYALQSHQRTGSAQKAGYFNDEIISLFDHQGGVIHQDTGVREESTLEKLGTLKPVFDRPFGNVTAGNSSQVSDGAAFLLLASREAVEHYQLPVLGRIIDTAWAALEPERMGLGPVFAIQALIANQQISLNDIDYFEINEAFSAQVLACLKALRNESGFEIVNDRLNVDGGAISIGHPVGASGARLVLHLLHILKRNAAKRGIASLCIGGGQGGAMLVEQGMGD